jgi:cytochrome P450
MTRCATPEEKRRRLEAYVQRIERRQARARRRLIKEREFAGDFAFPFPMITTAELLERYARYYGA